MPAPSPALRGTCSRAPNRAAGALVPWQAPSAISINVGGARPHHARSAVDSAELVFPPPAGADDSATGSWQAGLAAAVGDEAWNGGGPALASANTFAGPTASATPPVPIPANESCLGDGLQADRGVPPGAAANSICCAGAGAGATAGAVAAMALGITCVCGRTSGLPCWFVSGPATEASWREVSAATSGLRGLAPGLSRRAPVAAAPGCAASRECVGNAGRLLVKERPPSMLMPLLGQPPVPARRGGVIAMAGSSAGTVAVAYRSKPQACGDSTCGMAVEPTHASEAATAVPPPIAPISAGATTRPATTCGVMVTTVGGGVGERAQASRFCIGLAGSEGVAGLAAPAAPGASA
mmetsp:Transcript_103839/g.294175  ORF Transcript_103839/g.294175 Transcript_103839/m.294175 type:complete len:353 (+) Transcript_103839:88-1146(+)